MKLIVILMAASLAAQTFKALPPAGVAIDAQEKAALQRRVDELSENLKPIAKHALYADVVVFREAVRYALAYGEFFKADEVKKAHRILDEGLLRARQLQNGQHPWTTATGLVVRGYRSGIDDSYQPYGLVIPAGWRAVDAQPWRLDLWFHGRSDTLSEVNFLYERLTSAGQFAPPDAIMLHVYGRYCNATKFAGEVDVLEAMASAKGHYRIDENRVFARGFSMGGASAWHLGAHYADLWAGVAPGAGFAETKEYQDLEKKKQMPPWWEQRLWTWYDATMYAANFFNTGLVAYSGEKDKQIQAAKIMSLFLATEGMSLAHVIGPDTEHKYHPDSKPVIEAKLAPMVRDAHPRSVRFTTFTLRYNRMRWVEVLGMEEHWQRARVNAQITDSGEIEIETANVNRLRLDFSAGGWKGALDRPVEVRVNGVRAGKLLPLTDRTLRGEFVKTEEGWALARGEDRELRKRPGLQGPIDDAFLSRFIFVLPTGKPLHERTGRWVEAESKRAVERWRALFRGDALVKRDVDITDADIATANLVLWGDASSNALLARVWEKLPLRWNAAKLSIGKQECAAESCMPVMVYPNPLNARRYLVLNSGPTLRDATNGTNSQQTPKLPDAALMDLSEPPGAFYPGRVAWAGFFDERWQVK